MLPKPFFKTVKAKIDENSQEPFDVIWLQILSGSHELLPFKVYWVERFPVIDKLAYVFPLKTYHALEASRIFPELRYYPELKGSGGSRLLEIYVNTEKNIMAI